jgi:hypothetical protein
MLTESLVQWSRSCERAATASCSRPVERTGRVESKVSQARTPGTRLVSLQHNVERSPPH